MVDIRKGIRCEDTVEMFGVYWRVDGTHIFQVATVSVQQLRSALSALKIIRDGRFCNFAGASACNAVAGGGAFSARATAALHFRHPLSRDARTRAPPRPHVYRDAD